MKRKPINYNNYHALGLIETYKTKTLLKKLRALVMS
jgi:hypothetical protein